VLNLHRAAMENRKEQIKVNVLGLSVAVMNAMDAAFGGGKGKILESWLKAIDGPGDSQRERRAPLSSNTRAFFSSAPVVTQKE